MAADAERAARPHSQRIDPAEYYERVDRITDLFGSMMETANELVMRRCPYKNRFDQCTANFGCRNQRKPDAPGALKRCASDDKLDFRSAWETD